MRVFLCFIFSVTLETQSKKRKKKIEESLCDSMELKLPENATSWICDKSNQNKVEKGGRCELQCDWLFVPDKSEL